MSESNQLIIKTPYGDFEFPNIEGQMESYNRIVETFVQGKRDSEKIEKETEKAKIETTQKIVSAIGNGIDVLNNIISDEEINNLPDDLK